MSPMTRRQTGKIPLCYMKLSVELNSFRLFLTSISSDPQPSDLTVQILSPHTASSAVCFLSLCLVCVISHSVLPVILFTREALQIPCN